MQCINLAIHMSARSPAILTCLVWWLVSSIGFNSLSISIAKDAQSRKRHPDACCLPMTLFSLVTMHLRYIIDWLNGNKSWSGLKICSEFWAAILAISTVLLPWHWMTYQYRSVWDNDSPVVRVQTVMQTCASHVWN